MLCSCVTLIIHVKACTFPNVTPCSPFWTYLRGPTHEQNKADELVREDALPAHHKMLHFRYKTYALHVTVLWDRVEINRQMVRIPVACLEIVGGVTLMRTYVLACNTNANYLACACFDVLAFARSCICACVCVFRTW
jgi:hypothetical protein